jgi:hypothetical protein
MPSPVWTGLVWGFFGLVGLALLIIPLIRARHRLNRSAAERTERLKVRLRERKIERIRLTDRLKEWETYRQEVQSYMQRRNTYPLVQHASLDKAMYHDRRPSHTWSCRYLDNGDCDCDDYATRDYLDHVDEMIAIIEDELKPPRERKGLLAGRPDYVWDKSYINRNSEASNKRREEFQRQQEAYWNQRIAESDQERGKLT